VAETLDRSTRRLRVAHSVGEQQFCGHDIGLFSRNEQRRSQWLYHESLDLIEHDRSKYENMRRCWKQGGNEAKKENQKEKEKRRS
jgi:hypothetical protein